MVRDTKCAVGEKKEYDDERGGKEGEWNGRSSQRQSYRMDSFLREKNEGDAPTAETSPLIRSEDA